MTHNHAEGLQYHALPTDDPLRALNILREEAGLEPLSPPDHSEPEDGRRRHAIHGKASKSPSHGVSKS